MHNEICYSIALVLQCRARPYGEQKYDMENVTYVFLMQTCWSTWIQFVFVSSYGIFHIERYKT